MNSFLAFRFLALGCLIFLACSEETKPLHPLTLTPASFEKSEGRDCANMDSLHNHCASVQFSWLEPTDGSDTLKTVVKVWSDSFLKSILATISYDNIPAATVEEAAQRFLSAHEEWSKDAPESPLGEWSVGCTDTILLNDGKHLTLRLTATMFTGGAHPSSVANTATFDVASGKQLTWNDLVTDIEALKKLAEKAFRATRSEIFDPTDGSEAFNFDDVFRFALPANFGLTDKGIYFYYDPYEVTPYAFGTTDFVIPFEELGSIKK